LFLFKINYFRSKFAAFSVIVIFGSDIWGGFGYTFTIVKSRGLITLGGPSVDLYYYYLPFDIFN